MVIIPEEDSTDCVCNRCPYFFYFSEKKFKLNKKGIRLPLYWCGLYVCPYCFVEYCGRLKINQIRNAYFEDEIPSIERKRIEWKK